MKQLQGKVAFITGASSGIGRAIAIRLASYGCNLFLTGRNAEELLITKKECDLFGVQVISELVDITQENRVLEVVQQALSIYNQVDILINNAGISQRSLIYDTPITIDRQLMEINYFGTINITKALLPNFRKTGNGYIVVISSMAGLFGFPYRSAYSASKHALHGFFETLQAETDTKELGVTIVCPGRIQTNISLSALTADGTKHSKMDEGQLHGIPVDVCAQKIIFAMVQKKPYVIIAKGEKWLYRIKLFSQKLFLYISKKVKAN